MTVGCYHVAGSDEATYRACARLMVQSIRVTMPGVPVVHFTDAWTAPLEDCDEVRRLPYQPLSLGIAEHYAACEGDWLFLDTDVVVQRDVRDIVADPSWEIAVAVRPPTLAPSRFVRKNPYNTGVLFSRSPAFWQGVLRRIGVMSPKAQAWIGLQRAVGRVIDQGRVRVRLLDQAYNWSPRSLESDRTDAAIVHYKGTRRKAWLLGDVAA